MKANLEEYPYDPELTVDWWLREMAYRTHSEDCNYGDGDKITNDDVLRIIQAFVDRIEQLERRIEELEQEIVNVHREMNGETI